MQLSPNPRANRYTLGAQPTAHEGVISGSMLSAANNGSGMSSRLDPDVRSTERRGGDDDHSGGHDVARLLVGLQRGMVPGADSSVAFLCEKFSDLIERLRHAESSEREQQQRRTCLEVQLADEQAAAAAERSVLEAACEAARQEQKKLTDKVDELSQHESSSCQKLTRLRGKNDALLRRQRQLEEESVSDRARWAEASSRMRYLHTSRHSSEEDLRRLQDRLHQLREQASIAENAKRAYEEATSHDDVRSAELRTSVLSEEEEQQGASERLSTQRKELAETLNELALVKERLAAVHVTNHRDDGDLQRLAERKHAACNEVQRLETWLATAMKKSSSLRTVEQGLEQVHGDTEEARARLSLEQAHEKMAAASKERREEAAAEAHSRNCARSKRWQELEEECLAAKAEAAAAEDEERSLENALQQLQHAHAAGGGIRKNLQNELTLLLRQREQLTKNLDEQELKRIDMRQRLALTEPALVNQKRSVRSLESRLEEARTSAAQERSVTERLERETGLSHDNLQALRDQNVRLAEQNAEFEVQLSSLGNLRDSLSSARTPSAGRSNRLASGVQQRARARSTNSRYGGALHVATPHGSGSAVMNTRGPMQTTGSRGRRSLSLGPAQGARGNMQASPALAAASRPPRGHATASAQSLATLASEAGLASGDIISVHHAAACPSQPSSAPRTPMQRTTTTAPTTAREQTVADPVALSSSTSVPAFVVSTPSRKRAASSEPSQNSGVPDAMAGQSSRLSVHMEPPASDAAVPGCSGITKDTDSQGSLPERAKFGHPAQVAFAFEAPVACEDSERLAVQECTQEEEAPVSVYCIPAARSGAADAPGIERRGSPSHTLSPQHLNYLQSFVEEEQRRLSNGAGSY
eukprot:TRINITY_DN3445_c0_g1_i2.p1 TRINITY_DN3445_c0_g1~~TRINITY_DN3445_c0_g1_i2.p1  ORF type:complete len:873 (+),score=157.63 TRINITY_DN3445_c0_g1_i2:161-2779(+)